MKQLRFIKFDGVYPYAAYKVRVDENKSLIESFSRKEYYEWIISQRITYSDYYSHNLQAYNWMAEEFFLNDPLYIKKVAMELFGNKYLLLKNKERVKDKLRPIHERWAKFVIKEYLKVFSPDVIFIREGNPLESSFWGEFSRKSLLVNRIAMNFPKIWNPGYFDLIFTTLESYKNVFESNGIPTYMFYDGFDKRILDEVKEAEKVYDVSHVGGVGNTLFKAKTRLLEFIAQNHDLYWWGWSRDNFVKGSYLTKSYQGPVLGIDMFKISKKSKIVLNDYGNISEGVGVNMRIYETLGVGTFLLTREADNLKKFPKEIFIMFKDEKDCSDKISYFLKNDKEREEIAKAGQEYALKNFDYRNRMKEMDQILRFHLQRKDNLIQ